MKRFFTLTLIVLTLFVSCKNENLIDYIERGFGKPIVEDVCFNISNLGENNKIYIPSGSEIEVEFTIKNKYEIELKGELSFDEDKKDLFNTLPYIKELTLTKMVVAFNFKEDGEPSATDNFLGASVPISLKLYDKRNSRFLTGQIVEANCNTVPNTIPKEKIIYNEATDEYVIELPKTIGIHKDITKVEFLLSSDYGNENNVKPKVVLIDESSQGTSFPLPIKGNKEWQLKNPSGERKLKAIVYDKAGLKSSEGGKKTQRIFTSITLVPQSINISLKDIDEEGVPVPTIKELADFFQGDDWKKAGYTISYQSTDFTYNEATKRFKKNGNLTNGDHSVTVTLNNNGNTANATYTINASVNTTPGINQSKLKITDETEYKDLLPPDGVDPLILSGETINFQDVGDAKEGSLIVPYTGFETNIKVHVEAISSYGKIEDASNSGNASFKDFDLTLGKDSENIETLKFFACSEDVTIKKEYRIKFTRGASSKVTINLKHENLPEANGKVTLSWIYKKMSVNSGNPLSDQKMEMQVARGAKVRLDVQVGNGAKIGNYTFTPNQTVVIPVDGGSVEFNVNQDITLDITLKPQASFEWSSTGGIASGDYEKACVSYNNGQNTVTYTDDTTERKVVAVQKEQKCEFWIEGLNPEKHTVLRWTVNEQEIINTNPSDPITLSADKTRLTIESANDNYKIKIYTVALCELTIKVCDANKGDITDSKYSFEVKKNSSDGPVIQPKTPNYYVGIMPSTQLYINATEGFDSKYDIAGWEIKKANDSDFSGLTGSGKDKRSFSITENTIVRLILKEKMFKVEWGVEGGDAGFDVKVNGHAFNSTTQRYVELNIDSSFEITANPNKKYLIRTWKINDSEHTQENAPDGVEISGGNKKLTIKNVKKNYKIVLMLEIRKCTITVAIEKLSGDSEPHHYVIKATNTEIGTMTNAGTPPPYKYEGVPYNDEATCRFEATTGEGQTSVYEVDKWQYYGANNQWHDYSSDHYEGGNKAILKIAPIGDLKLKVMLKKIKYIFKITRLSSATSGKLKITSGDDPSNATLLKEITDVAEHEISATGENIYFEVLDVNNNNNSEKVVDCRINNLRAGDFLDDGFWKLERQKLTLLSGNKFELVIAPVQRIDLSVYDGSDLYNNNDYKLIVKQSDGDKNANHIMLPINNGIEVNYKLIENKGYYSIYITEGTKLDFRMDNLPEDKEIGMWKNGNDVALGEAFNENHAVEKIRIGKEEIKDYVCPVALPPKTASIIADIRNATRLATFSIKDYKDKIKTNDDKIKLEVSYSNGGQVITTLLGTYDAVQCRVVKNKKIKLKIEEEAGHDYHFAEWEGSDVGAWTKVVSEGDEFKKEIEIEVPNKNFTIDALCTKTVVVKVHKMLPGDRNKNNLPSRWFDDLINGSLGDAKVGKMNGTNFQEDASIQCKIGGAYVSDIDIANFSSANGGNLAIQYSKVYVNVGNALVFWKYAFGGDGQPKYNTQDNKTYIEEEGGELTLKFKNPEQCVVLHIWLYKVLEK